MSPKKKAIILTRCRNVFSALTDVIHLSAEVFPPRDTTHKHYNTNISVTLLNIGQLVDHKQCATVPELLLENGFLCCVSNYRFPRSYSLKHSTRATSNNRAQPTSGSLSMTV